MRFWNRMRLRVRMGRVETELSDEIRLNREMLEEEFVRDRARQLLEQLDTPGTVDMVPAFTTPLPNDATVHLLGFPMQDATQIATWSKEVMESEWPAMNRTERGEGMAGAFPEYTAYVDQFV